MSNIGKRPITIQSGIQITTEGSKVTVTGPKGTLDTKLPEGIGIEVGEGVVNVKRLDSTREGKKFFGLSRSLIANMVQGVGNGFERKLELSGVGYRAKVEGRDLVLNVGFANQVRITPPESVSFQVAENTISVTGINKELVGNTASKVREVRPPDPYKAKGIRYSDEKIKKKAGKAAKAGGK